MSIKKAATLIIITAVLITIIVLIFVNINFFKEISPLSPEPELKPAAETEEPVPAYAIPPDAALTDTMPAGQTIEDIINSKKEKQKKLEEQELEAERIRNANRAEAFARQKELEAFLLRAETEESKKADEPILPKKDIEPPSAEKMKEMEEKGIISL